MVVKGEGESLDSMIRRFRHARMQDGVAAAHYSHQEAASKGERRRAKRQAAERRRLQRIRARQQAARR